MSNHLVLTADPHSVFAKTSPHVLDPPTFALHLGLHFVNKYKHITKAFIDIIALKWSRIEVCGGVPCFNSC